MYLPEFRSQHQTTHKNCAPITEVIIFFVDLSLLHTADFYAKNTSFHSPMVSLLAKSQQVQQELHSDPYMRSNLQNNTPGKHKTQNWVWQIGKLWCLNFHQIFAIQTNHLVYIRAVYHWDFVRISWVDGLNKLLVWIFLKHFIYLLGLRYMCWSTACEMTSTQLMPISIWIGAELTYQQTILI